MTRIVGVDGCRTGWVAVEEDTSSGLLRWHVFPLLLNLLKSTPQPSVVAVDVPIGLPDLGSRECDIQARRLLGVGRGSSVFPAPIRGVMQATSHAEASAHRRRLEGKGLSIQAWGIIPKILEVDLLLRTDTAFQDIVFEVHPEICFQQLSGRPMAFPKKRADGRNERLAMLRPLFGEAPIQAAAALGSSGAAMDDVLDAFAALWSARRIATGSATVLPLAPPRDAYGLPMRIVA